MFSIDFHERQIQRRLIKTSDISFAIRHLFADDITTMLSSHLF